MRKQTYFMTFLFLAACLFIANFSFQSTESALAQKIEEIPTNKAAKSDMPNNVDKDEAAIEKVIAEYCRLAKLGKFDQLTDLVVRVSSDDYFNFDNKKARKAKENGGDGKSNKETPVLLSIPELYYNSLTKSTPEIIYVGERTFSKILKRSINDKRVKTLVRLENKSRNTRFIYMNFYLVKDKQRVWKIYNVEHVLSQQINIDGNESFI